MEENSIKYERIFFPSLFGSDSKHRLFNNRIEVNNYGSNNYTSASNISLIPKEGNFKCLVKTIFKSDIHKLSKVLNELIKQGDIDEIIQRKLTEDLELTKSKVNDSQIELNQLLMDEQERAIRIEELKNELEESQAKLVKIKSDLESL